MDGELPTFDQLKARHDLPNSQYFRYIQLRHAFQSQFKNKTIESFQEIANNEWSSQDALSFQQGIVQNSAEGCVQV